MGGDIKGGGLFIYDYNKDQNHTTIYGEGLRVPRVKASLELEGFHATSSLGKRKGFQRGVIFHIRSNATQYITWHCLFGGFRKSMVERFFINFWWKRWIKRCGPFLALLWTIQVISHRDYDTNAYCYFYFSD